MHTIKLLVGTSVLTNYLKGQITSKLLGYLKHVSGLAGLGEHVFITAIGLNQQMFWLKQLGQNSVCSLFEGGTLGETFSFLCREGPCFPMSDLGTSLAAYTRYQVIHAAAWMEFSAHLQELVAGTLCASGPPWWSWCIWGLQGNPSPSLASPRFVGSYALTSRAQGAPTVGAASSSHGLAFGTAAACWFKRDLGQRSRGSATMPLRRASDLGSLDILPVHVGLAVERLDVGDDGIDTEEFFELVRIWQQGRRPWREPWSSLVGTPGIPREVANAGRALRAILGSYDIEYIPPSASFVASPRSSLVESADRSCVKAATSGQCPLCIDSSGSD